MNINLAKELNLKSFGQKGWYRSKEFECPICGRSDKFGIRLTDKGGLVHCFYDHHKESLWKYLKRHNKQHLLKKSDEHIEIGWGGIDEESLFISNKAENKPIEEIKLPTGYKPFKGEDDYLKSRNFNKSHYEVFKPGYCRLHPSIDKSYIVFLVYCGGILLGWLARSRKSKEWHKENLKTAKEGKCKLQLRYYNSSEIEFNNLLGGIDEIIKGKTHTVIVVEGLFDKVSVDTKLKLNESDEIKCVCSWGNSLSVRQAWMLKEKGVRTIYLLYDNNTIEESKAASMKMFDFEEVLVGEIKQDADPGDLSADELLDTLSNAVDFFYFYMNRLSIKLM